MRNDNKEIENLRNEIQNLRNQNYSLNKENQKLKEDIKNLNQKFAYLNLAKDQEIKKIKEQNEKLVNIANVLKSKLSSHAVESKNYDDLSDGEKLVALNFTSVDQRINHTTICKNKTNFCDIEGQLYEKFPEYEDGENLFTFNGIIINRWKTLEDNGIKGYTIVLQRIED